jgi:flagellar basal-body rod protein FlgC
MDLIKTMDIAASGMTAQRTRMNVISTNLANANTTRTATGVPYRRRTVIFQTTPVGVDFQQHLHRALSEEPCGVKVTDIVSDLRDFKRVFDPSHPDADQDGYVSLPNVTLVQEMVQMLNANRAYEANAAAVQAAKDMALKALEIGR